MDIQSQYDKIYIWFKTSTEFFDNIEWDGKTCSVILNNTVVEEYILPDLKEMIPDF
ncbi:MAG: hypothetical protein LBT27_00775 [Prevotellaceae bacterium]|jgi:hypothetical protein|nr:hypothetical protein [Prevotellaceae bacterium]